MAAKPTYDRDKITQLRMSLIEAGLAIMSNKAEVKRWSRFKKDYILKVGSRALPVLNAGKDDDSDLFPPSLLGGATKNAVPNNNINKETSEDEKKDS